MNGIDTGALFGACDPAGIIRMWLAKVLFCVYIFSMLNIRLVTPIQIVKRGNLSDGDMDIGRDSAH